MHYNTRLKQNQILYRFGQLVSILGAMGFVIAIIAGIIGAYFNNITELGEVSIGVFGLGWIYIIYFSRAGWHKAPIVDFVLNQFSILLTTIGFLMLIKESSIQTLTGQDLLFSLLLVFGGFILAGLGMKYTTKSTLYYPSADDEV